MTTQLILKIRRCADVDVESRITRSTRDQSWAGRRASFKACGEDALLERWQAQFWMTVTTIHDPLPPLDEVYGSALDQSGPGGRARMIRVTPFYF